ncbi:unnamed protein product [Protopolystoma xenopodis]|uniref:Uncharacterized protein n=1 Tax=Protopolystoma xenopodis TaxID=117903 RepID=A0A3S5FEP0_9PLAT|nr:unnamed protein product [Protopolystoma xenopodis]
MFRLFQSTEPKPVASTREVAVSTNFSTADAQVGQKVLVPMSPSVGLYTNVDDIEARNHYPTVLIASRHQPESSAQEVTGPSLSDNREAEARHHDQMVSTILLCRHITKGWS